MTSRVSLLFFLLSGAGLPNVADAAIDPELIGTWQLEYPGGSIYWALREDGVYRLYGLGANPGQVGKLEASGGKFSMQAAFFADAGPYELKDANTWIVTGRLGPGTWKRVWKPGDASGTIAAGSPACGLVTAEEVALVLREPVKGGPARGDAGRCVFEAELSGFHEVEVYTFPSRRQAWMTERSRPDPRKINVPGIGEDAFVSIDGGEHAVLRVLKGGTELRITLTMKPSPTPEDVPLLGELGAAADKRL
jgi:hypothetical protein